MSTLETIQFVIICLLIASKYLMYRVDKDYLEAARREGARSAQAMDREILERIIQNKIELKTLYKRALIEERNRRKVKPE